MKDAEIRGLLLKTLYDRRREQYIDLSPRELKLDLPKEDILICCDQLGEAGLIVFKEARAGGGQLFAGRGHIAARGVDFVESGGQMGTPINVLLPKISAPSPQLQAAEEMVDVVQQLRTGHRDMEEWLASGFLETDDKARLADISNRIKAWFSVHGLSYENGDTKARSLGEALVNEAGELLKMIQSQVRQKHQVDAPFAIVRPEKLEIPKTRSDKPVKVLQNANPHSLLVQLRKQNEELSKWLSSGRLNGVEGQRFFEAKKKIGDWLEEKGERYKAGNQSVKPSGELLSQEARQLIEKVQRRVREEAGIPTPASPTLHGDVQTDEAADPYEGDDAIQPPDVPSSSDPPDGGPAQQIPPDVIWRVERPGKPHAPAVAVQSGLAVAGTVVREASVSLRRADVTVMATAEENTEFCFLTPEEGQFPAPIVEIGDAKVGDVIICTGFDQHDGLIPWKGNITRVVPHQVNVASPNLIGQAIDLANSALIFQDGNLVAVGVVFEGGRLIARPASLLRQYDKLKNDFVGDENELPPSTPSLRRLHTTVANDSDTVDDYAALDRLGVMRDVEAFAWLILDKKTRPPLAIGLFGEWGSGKSFFMNALDQELRAYAPPPHDKGPPNKIREGIVDRVARIRFNAWHYTDANLWASLMTRVMTGLAEHYAPREKKPDEYLKILDALADKAAESGEIALAAQREVDAAKTEAERLREEITSTKATAARLMKQLASTAELERLYPKEEVDQLVSELGSRRVRITKSIQVLSNRPESIAILLGVILAAYLEKEILDTYLATWVAGLSAGIYWLKQGLAMSERWVSLTENVASVVDGSSIRVKLAELEEEIAQKRELLRSAEAKRDAADSKHAGYSFERYFVDHLEKRSQADEYRTSLGMVSVVRRDLERLSEFLDRREVGKRGQDSEDGTGQLTPPLDRIVLFIDDLDRCESHRVLEVLQAIHLLLAFDLFVVVVGVDRRWLEKPLEKKYEGIKCGDYIEKIFQLPYCLRPVGARGFRDLVTDLLVDSSGVEQSMETQSGVGLTQDEANGLAEDPATEPTEEKTEPAESTPDEGDETEKSAANSSQPLIFEPYEVEFLSTELNWLGASPRTIKRIVNVYRLVKARFGDDPAFWDRSTDNHEYKAIALLIAIQHSYPGEAKKLMRGLFYEDPSDQSDYSADREGSFRKFLNELFEPREPYDFGIKLEANEKLWGRLRKNIENPAFSEVTVATMKYWAPRVSQYAFDPSCHNELMELAVPRRESQHIAALAQAQSGAEEMMDK